MKIEYFLNEEFRAGGKDAELEFIKLLDGKAKLINTKTKVTYKFDFGSGFEKMTQSQVLEKLIEEKTKIDVKRVKVQIDITDTNLYKCDLIATGDVERVDGDRTKWFGVEKINEGDKIEVKKETYYTKAFYAETFKFASAKTMDKYLSAQDAVKENFDKITDEIIRQLDGFIRAKTIFLSNPKKRFSNVYFPYLLAIKKGDFWGVKKWEEYEFWRDLKIKKIYYGKDAKGIGVPRILFTFNEDDNSINKRPSILKILNEFNVVGTSAIKDDDKIKTDKNTADERTSKLKLAKNTDDSKIIPMNTLEFTIKIPFEVIFERE